MFINVSGSITYFKFRQRPNAKYVTDVAFPRLDTLAMPESENT